MPNAFDTRHLTSIFACMIAAACASSSKADLDETSARGHRLEAARENERADFARDPDQAAVLRKHAEAHLRAARALKRYEDAECRDIPTDARGSCPLLRGVKSVESIPEGARIVFEDQSLATTALGVMRCHLAFSRANQDEDMDACPLYIKGIRVERGLVDNSIDFMATTTPAAAEIRGRIKRIIRPSQLEPMSDAR